MDEIKGTGTEIGLLLKNTLISVARFKLFWYSLKLA